jgi:hypothetical protein
MEGELKLQLMDDDSVRNSQGVPLGGNGIGNANFINGETYIIDRTPPQVTSIIRAGSNPAISPTADFIVTFSEPVNGVEITDFSVIGSNIIKASVIDMQIADPFYWVKVNTGAGSGSLRLDLLDNGNITDKAGNPLSNGNFTGESLNIAKTTVDFSAPTIKPLSSGVTNNPFALLTWSSVWNAQAYEAFIARDINFSQIILIQTSTETRLNSSTPLSDGLYYARVRAYNPDLNPGKFSATISFTIDSTPPLAPSLLTPANGAATVRRPWFKWSAVSGAVKYQIEVDNNADFSSPEFSATTNKITLQAKNLLARPYYWRVRASDAAGNWSAWSATFNINPK